MYIGTNSKAIVHYIIDYPILDLNNHVAFLNIINALWMCQFFLCYLKNTERQRITIDIQT